MTTADFLATVPLFKSLDASELAHFGQLVREKSYPKGSVILFEDDPGDALFVVRAGRVKVVLVAEDGREVILGILSVGEHFGELALIDDQPRSASCSSRWRIPRCSVLETVDFRKRVEGEIRPLHGRFSPELSRRLRRADGQIGSLNLLDVPDSRVCCTRHRRRRRRPAHRESTHAPNNRPCHWRESRNCIQSDARIPGIRLDNLRTPPHPYRGSGSIGLKRSQQRA